MTGSRQDTCPYLTPDHPAGALEPEPGSACCCAVEPPRPVAVQHQVVFCLAARFSECSRYIPVSAPLAASERGSRHALISSFAVLATVTIGTAISFTIIGNPLTVEPDVQGSPTVVAGTVATSTPVAGGAATATITVLPASPPSTPSPTPAVITSTATPAPAAAGTVYRVQPGDTLAAIAVRFHVSIAALVAANSLTNVDRLLAGQELRIPPAGTSTPPAR